jgi:hypothetical protein
VRFLVGRVEHLARLLEVVVAHVVPVVGLAIAQKAAASLVDGYAHVDETHVCTGGAGNFSNHVALASTEVAMVEDDGLAIGKKLASRPCASA